jgi:adenylate cyclase
VVSVVTVGRPSFFRFLELKLYDTQLRSISSPPAAQSSETVIVDIDEKSLAEFGQWPWPRNRIAQLLSGIRDSGARSIGLDMLFPEADRSSPARLLKDLEREYGVKVRVAGDGARLPDNDTSLAYALARGPSVLGYYFSFSDLNAAGRKCLLHPLNAAFVGSMAGNPSPTGLFTARDVSCSLDRLAEAAHASGFINITPDTDGVLRRAPLLIRYRGDLYPSLSLATVMQSLGAHQLMLHVSSGGLDGIRMGGTFIPVDSNANMLIRFRSPGDAFTHLSALDILRDRFPREKIRGKTVFVGAAAAGLEEYRTTPLATVVPGVEIHAAIADSILRKDFVTRPDWAPGMELMLVLLLGILSSLLLCSTRSVTGLVTVTVLGLAVWVSSTALLQVRGVSLSPLYPLLVLSCNFVLLTFLKYLQEERMLKERTRELVVTQNFTIQCLAALTETRDSETGGHILRCQNYVRILSRRLAKDSRYSDLLDDETIELLYRSAPLHDIGKVGIPDSILLKPARLSEDEYGEMKKHTLYGREAIQRAEEMYGPDIKGSFLEFGKEIAYSHHEKWDGSGYPEGRSGDGIPLFARIMALADVYDAMISKRRYKPSFSHEEAAFFIMRSRGSHFDPDVVDAFQEVQEEFKRVAEAYPD